MRHAFNWPPLQEKPLEAFREEAALLPTNIQSGFILIGGLALLSLGFSRPTDDVDVAVTDGDLHLFYSTDSKDTRFAKTPVCGWKYTSPSTRIVVSLEFLLQGSAYAPVITATESLLERGLRAGLAELVCMKAKSWVGREEEGDLIDLRFLPGKNNNDGLESELMLREGDEEVLIAMMEELGDGIVRYCATFKQREWFYSPQD